MDAQKKLPPRGLSSDERVNLISEETPPTLEAALWASPLAIPEPSVLSAQDIPGLFFAQEIFDTPDFECFLDAVNKSPGNWDTSLKQHRKDFGYILDQNGKSIGPATPSPDECQPLTEYLLGMGNQHCPEETPQAINKMSVNTYVPEVGIGPHVDQTCLGEFVAIASMGGGATILFTPSRRATRSRSIYMPAYSALLLTGRTRHEYAHSLECTGSDLLNGKQMPRTKRHSLVCRFVPSDASSAAAEEPV